MKRLAWLGLLAAGRALAWETSIEPATDAPMAWTFATITPTGDVRLSDDDGLQWDSWRGFQFSRYPLPRRYSVAAPHASGRNLQVTSFERQDRSSYPRYDRPCRLQRDLFGDDQRVVGRTLYTDFAFVLKRAATEIDESNIAGVEAFAGHLRAVRLRKDCSSEALAAVPGQLTGATAVPGTRDALVLHADAAGHSSLSRASADAVHWTRPLLTRDGASITAFAVVAFAKGDYAVVTYFDQAYHVLRYAADGGLRMQTRLAGSWSEMAPYEDLLLVHESLPDGQGGRFRSMLAIDAEGRSQRPRYDGNELTEAAPRALEPYRFDKTSPPIERGMLLLAAPPTQTTPVAPFEFRGLDALLAYPPLAPGEQAMAQVSVSGDLLVRRGAELDIVRRVGPRENLRVDVPRVGASATQLALHADDDGTALAYAFEGEGAQLEWRDAAGSLRWRVPLAAGREVVAMSSNAQRVCLASTAGDTMLHCFDKAHGGALVAVRLHSGTTAVAGLHVDAADVATLASTASCAGDCPPRLSMLRVAPDGTLGVVAERDAHTVVADAGLGLVAWQQGKVVEVLARDGTPQIRHEFELFGPGLLAAVGAGGRVLFKNLTAVDGPWEFAQLSGSRDPDWQAAARTAWCEPPQARAVAHDWLVWGLTSMHESDSAGFCDGVRLMLIDGATGALRWSDTQTYGLDLRRVQVLPDDAGEEVIVVIEQGEGSARERSAARHALSDGRRLVAERVAGSVAGFGTEALAPDGTLASAAFTREGPRLSRIALQRTPSPLAQAPLDTHQRALRGSWAARDTRGQGVFLDVLDGHVYGGWFTYRAAGGYHGEGQRWYLLVETGGTAHEPELAIEAVEGGRFLQSAASTRVGSARLRWESCDRASLVYDFDAGEHADRGGAIALDRVAPASVACGAQETVAESQLGGAWSVDGVTGQGLVFDRRGIGGTELHGAWFTHDVAGDGPRWFTMIGTAMPDGDGMTVTLYRTLGGSLDGEATDNTWAVGNGTLTFEGCDRARFEIRFVPGEEAHAFAGRSGTLSLRRSGGCAPLRHHAGAPGPR